MFQHKLSQQQYGQVCVCLKRTHAEGKEKEKQKIQSEREPNCMFCLGEWSFYQIFLQRQQNSGDSSANSFLNYTEPTTSHDTISRLQSVWLPYFHHNHSSYFQSIRSPSSSIPHPVVALITSALESPTLIFTHNRLLPTQHFLFSSSLTVATKVRLWRMLTPINGSSCHPRRKTPADHVGPGRSHSAAGCVSISKPNECRRENDIVNERD